MLSDTCHLTNHDMFYFNCLPINAKHTFCINIKVKLKVNNRYKYSNSQVIKVIFELDLRHKSCYFNFRT